MEFNLFIVSLARRIEIFPELTLKRQYILRDFLAKKGKSMSSRVTSRSFSGSVYSLVSAGDAGQEILHIRAVDGDGDNVDMEFDISNGKIMPETLRLRLDRDHNLAVRVTAVERKPRSLETISV